MRLKNEITLWARRYRTALRRFIRQQPMASSAAAVRLGHQAAELGLDTLAVAGIHEQALHTVTPPDDAPDSTRRELLVQADAFFKETIVPIEATHHAARTADSRIDQLTLTLQRRTTEASASGEQLEQAIIQREAAEANAGVRATHYDRLLAEAQQMQQRLRDQMRGILSQHESERKRISEGLRDEIAQALLAIDINLLTMKNSKHVNTKKTEKSIAHAHRVLRELRT